MKMIYCTFNISVLEAVLARLEAMNVNEYQVVDHVTAKNIKSNPRFNNPVWPGYNATIFIQIKDEEKAKEVMLGLKNFNKKVFTKDELITCCSWNIDEYFYD